MFLLKLEYEKLILGGANARVTWSEDNDDSSTSFPRHVLYSCSSLEAKIEEPHQAN